MARDNLQVVENEDDRAPARDEDEAAAEQALLAAFAATRTREKTEVACVEIPRYPMVPKRDANGRLVRDANRALVMAGLDLYFRRLEPGTLVDLRTRHTHSEPVKRRGRTEYEDKVDDEQYSLDVAYTALVPWCRERYFDDQKLWGDDPVGTGKEFMHVRLNPGELAYCLDAVLQLEGLGDARAETLGKA